MKRIAADENMPINHIFRFHDNLCARLRFDDEPQSQIMLADQTVQTSHLLRNIRTQSSIRMLRRKTQIESGKMSGDVIFRELPYHPFYRDPSL